MNVAVIGTGYVGLVTGVGFAETGNSVICADVDASKIERLQRKVGELVLDIDILKEANKGRPFGPGTQDE